jgi:hypothetical protein
MIRFSFCVLTSFYLTISVFGQFKNITLDERADKNLSCEPVIAINPKNPLNIVAASALDNVYFSLDGGATWQKKKISSPFGVYGDPVLLADSKGIFYYFHLSDPTGEGLKNDKSLDAIICQVSEDGGKTWDIGNPIGVNIPKDQDKPWADINSKGEIAVAWTQFDKYKGEDPQCKSLILLSTSSNGKKWSKPTEISGSPGNCLCDNNTVAGAMPAISDDKRMYVAWASKEKILLDRSFTNGSMWLTEDMEIGKQNGGWNLKIPGHEKSNGLPVLKMDRTKTNHAGLLYMVWAEQVKDKSDTDIRFVRSNQYGDFWTSPLKIGEDKNNRYQYMPSMCVDQATGMVYVLYYDRSDYEDNQTDVVLAYSVDTGSTFKTVKISETPFIPEENSFFGDYLGIAAYKGVITPIWTRMDGRKTTVMTSVIKQADLPK